MGEKLGAIGRLANRGKIDEAKAVLEEHIKAEHTFTTELSGLHVALTAYDRILSALKRWWDSGERFKGGSAKADLAFVNAKIREAQNKLAEPKALLRKLERDMKHKLD